MSFVPAPLPKSTATWTPITLEDTHPTSGQKTAFTFPRKMEAFLTSTPPDNFRGSGPDGKALWWPYFQERHKRHGSFWVQGHMLNDNVYGPGDPSNLVPICSYLNTQMEAAMSRRPSQRDTPSGMSSRPIGPVVAAIRRSTRPPSVAPTGWPMAVARCIGVSSSRRPT
jgi:hypothetical protein